MRAERVEEKKQRDKESCGAGSGGGVFGDDSGSAFAVSSELKQIKNTGSFLSVLFTLSSL